MVIGSLGSGPEASLYQVNGAVRLSACFRVTGGVTAGDGLISVVRLADGVWVGRGAETVRSAPPYEIGPTERARLPTTSKAGRGLENGHLELFVNRLKARPRAT